ncbi:MAG: ABC transporter permease [Vicinamibacterales bacterium]
MMATLIRPLRHAMRRLLQARGFSVAAILTLTLGISAATAVFSVVNGVLLRPLPYGNPDRLVYLSHTIVVSGISAVDQADATILYYAEHNRSFTALGGYQAAPVNLGGMSGAGATSTLDAERVPAGRVTADVFPALEVSALRGRLFSAQDDRPGEPPVVVISERLWRRKYGADAGILDRRIDIDGRPHEIIGVLADSVRFPNDDTELWLPLRLDRAKTESAMFDYKALARLRDSVTLQAAEADLQNLLPHLPEQYPGRMTAASIEQTRLRNAVRPLRDAVVGDIGPLLWIVLGAVVFVLAIACANVANLFLVRAEARQKEFAVQRALGAAPGTILLEFVSEGLLVSLAGGVLGVAAAAWSLSIVRSLGGALDIPRLAEVTIDGTVLVVAAAATILSALFVSAFPGFRALASPVSAVLTATGRSSTAGRDRHHARHLLVASQVALALVLLVGSGLMARTFWQLRAVQPGFDATHALAFRVALPAATYPTQDDSVRFFARAIDEVANVAGVEAVSVASKIPLDEPGRFDSAVFVEDQPLADGQLPGIHPVTFVTPDFFKAAGIPFLAGRTFGRPDPPNVIYEALASRAFAERYWPDGNVIGRRVRIYSNGGAWYTIVGLVGDVRGKTLQDPAEQMLYCPILPADPRWSARDLAFVVRTTADPTTTAGAVRNVIKGLDASLPLYRVRPLTDVLAQASSRTSFTFMLLGCASLVALVLGAIGLFGVLSYVVSLRTREMGIRLALGAQPRDVRLLVSRQALAVSLVGIVVGLAGALALSRFLATLLFEVSPMDPLVLSAATMVLLGVAVVASWMPARRAAAVDPTHALRSE